MRNRNTITIVVGLLLLVVFLGVGNVLASPLNKAKQTAVTPGNQDHPLVPELTDIIPLSAALSGTLANLENSLDLVPDFYTVEKTSAAIATELEKYTGKYKQLKERDNYSIAQLYALKQAVADKKYLLGHIDCSKARNLWATKFIKRLHKYCIHCKATTP